MSGVKKKGNRSAVFKQRTKNDDNAELSKSVIIRARKTGQLNLSSKGLSTGIHICKYNLCISIIKCINLEIRILMYHSEIFIYLVNESHNYFEHVLFKSM